MEIRHTSFGFHWFELVFLGIDLAIIVLLVLVIVLLIRAVRR